MGDRLVTAALLLNVGISDGGREEDVAVSVLDESIALARQTVDVTRLPYAPANRALLSLLQDQVDAARDLFSVTLQHPRDDALTAPVWEALTALGSSPLETARSSTPQCYVGSAAVRRDEPLSLPE